MTSSLDSSPDTLLLLYTHSPRSFGYSLYALDIYPSPPSSGDDAVTLPPPLLSFGDDRCYPLGMGSFLSDYKLYLVGGARYGSDGCVPSKATYYINLEDIPAAPDVDTKSVLKCGPDMEVAKDFPLVIPFRGMFYAFSFYLSQSTDVERFDPATNSWTHYSSDLVLPDEHEEPIPYANEIMSYVVHPTSIQLSTSRNVLVFDTDSNTWILKENLEGTRLIYDVRLECFESSRFYVASSVSPRFVFFYHKEDVGNFTEQIAGHFDPLSPYKEYMRYGVNQFLLQASEDRFCFACEGIDIDPYDYHYSRLPKKHIIVHVFDLPQDVAPAATDPSHSSSPGPRHRSLSRVLFAMDNNRDTRRNGEIINAFLINRKDLGQNAFKGPRLEDSQK